MKGELIGKGYSKYKKGVSVIEAILSLALAAILFSQVFNTLFSIKNISLDTSLRGDAMIFAKNNLQNSFNILSNNFYATNTPSLNLPPPFVGSIKIFDVTQCRRETKSKVSWSLDSFLTSRETYFSKIVSNLLTLKKLGKDCGGDDFVNLISSSTTLSVQSAIVPTTINSTGVDVFQHYAFVTATSEVSDESDLMITKLNEFPTITTTINSVRGLNSVDAANGHVFVAQNSTSSQLVIIDIQNKNSPLVVASSTLPDVAGSRPEGWSIYYFDSKIYIGTRRTAGHEFHIFDVSNPNQPRWLGSREINHNINNIVVRDDTAYLATSGNIRDLIVLDVHNPANITQKTALDLPGNEDGKSLYLIGNILYLGRFKSLANSGHHDFYTLDVSDITLDGNIPALGFYDVGADVNAVRVVGQYAFLATSNPNKEVVILDTRSSSLAFVKGVDLPSKATGIDYENGVLIVATLGTPGIFKINLKDNL